MSEINIERLKVYADYWDKVRDRLEPWQQSQVNTILGIPRPPKKAQEVEWVDGLPPVGCECEYRLGLSVNWFPCRIKAIAKNQGAIIECDCEFGEQYVSLHGSQPVEFRPLRTPEQRLRDELASLCDEYIKSDDYGHNLADAILSKYNLEPKQ